MPGAGGFFIVGGMRRTFWIYLLPLVLLMAVTLPHLGQGDFVTDTGRYAAVGLQAWRDPSLFWTLHLQPTVPYFNKPPLVFWIHGLFLHVFGVSVAMARFPSILAALGVVALSVSIVRRLLGNGVALASGCVLALTYEFFRRTREVSLDQWQLLFMLGAVWFCLRAASGKRWGDAWLAGVTLGLALMCKPFMALMVLPVMIWICRRPAMVWSMLAGCVLVALPWHVAMVVTHGDAFVTQYFGREILSRAQGEINAQPWWYYAEEMGRSYWPWWLAFAAGVWRFASGVGSPRRRVALKGALLWVGFWVVALSCFPDKRPRYELPLYPGMAIVAGYGLVLLPWRGLRNWYRRRLALTVGVVVLLGAVAAMLPLKVKDPPARDIGALLEWCREHTGEAIYSAALSTNDEGYFYLRLGDWPKAVPHGRRRLVPKGSYLVYTDGLLPTPQAKERVVFREGKYCVTKKE